MLRFQAPFSFGSGEELGSLMSAAGFGAIDLQVHTINRRLLPPSRSVPGLIASTPIADRVARLDEASRERLVGEVAERLAAYRVDDGGPEAFLPTSERPTAPSMTDRRRWTASTIGRSHCPCGCGHCNS